MTRLAFGLLLLGLAWRTVCYFMEFPIWGDEAMLAMNVARLDYGQLTQRLELCQVAPVLFLWGERAAFAWFGPGELSLRLLPFAAGVLALVLYWRLTGLLLEPRARLFAVGFLAVAFYPVAMGATLKPYSLDLLMALVLSVLAAQWLRAPEQACWLAGLALIAPVAVLSSFPAVFVAGGVSVALFARVWRAGWSARVWFAVYQVTLAAGFAAGYRVGLNQLDSASGDTTTRAGMTAYWGDSFPPDSPAAWPAWLVRLTTGRMAAYPVGDKNGGSAVTVLCCLAGTAWWARRRQWTYLLLFGTPWLLNLVAAALHRYPYGGAARLSQHLAPGLCVLAGLGLAALSARVSRTTTARDRGTIAVVVVFACIGLGGMIRDVIRPYYSPSYVWMRDAMRAMRAEAPAANPVVVCGDARTLECVFAWYWLNEGDRVSWNYEVPPAARSAGRVWGFYEGADADAAWQRLRDELIRHDPAWQLVKRIPYKYRPSNGKERSVSCELFCFARAR